MAANELALRKANDIRSLISQASVRKQLSIAAPKHLSVDRLLRVAMTAIQKTPRLLDCTPDSILACVMTCAELGLEPSGVLGQAYLVPYKNKRGIYQAQLIPGYRGYIALARRTGEVQSVQSQPVFENDYFVLEYGLEEKLEHRPMTGGPRGKIVGAYVYFKFKDGGHSFDYMTTEDIERIRKRSRASDDGPWKTDYNEMAKKTVIRRHAKLCPMSIEYAKAAALEDRALAGESQFDLLDSFEDSNAIEVEAKDTTPAIAPADQGPEEDPAPPEEKNPEASPEAIEKSFREKVAVAAKKTAGWTEADFLLIDEFVEKTAVHHKMTPEEVKERAVERFPDFWTAFMKKGFDKKTAPENGKGAGKGAAGKKGSKSPGKKKTPETPDSGPGMLRPCPDQDGKDVPTSTCLGCDGRDDCPSWDTNE